MQTFDFSVVRGDEFPGIKATLQSGGAPVDLTGYDFKCQFRRGSKCGQVSKDLSVGDGISVTDPANGVVTIDAFSTDGMAGTHYYDLEMTPASGGGKTTVLGGAMKILNDVTREASA